MVCRIRVANLPQDNKDEVMIEFIAPFEKNENTLFSLKKIALYDLLTKHWKICHSIKENT